MHNLKVTISAKLYDPHGRLIRTFRPRPAHSFLAQFIEFLCVQMSGANYSITNVSGGETVEGPNSSNFAVGAGASTTTYGILIGSGTTPIDIDDYALETQITVDLTVSAHVFTLSYPTPTSRRLAISRTFTNADPSPMAIEEVALYTSDGGGVKLMLDHTLYSVSIPASSALELTYRIDVSV